MSGLESKIVLYAAKLFALNTFLNALPYLVSVSSGSPEQRQEATGGLIGLLVVPWPISTLVSLQSVSGALGSFLSVVALVILWRTGILGAIFEG